MKGDISVLITAFNDEILGQIAGEKLQLSSAGSVSVQLLLLKCWIGFTEYLSISFLHRAGHGMWAFPVHISWRFQSWPITFLASSFSAGACPRWALVLFLSTLLFTWLHFLNQHRSVHSLRIHYAPSIPPHFLPELPAVHGRDWLCLTKFGFRSQWHLVPLWLIPSQFHGHANGFISNTAYAQV